MLKDLIIRGEERIHTALDRFEQGDSSELESLMHNGTLSKRVNMDLMEELDLTFSQGASFGSDGTGPTPTLPASRPRSLPASPALPPMCSSFAHSLTHSRCRLTAGKKMDGCSSGGTGNVEVDVLQQVIAGQGGRSFDDIDLTDIPFGEGFNDEGGSSAGSVNCLAGLGGTPPSPSMLGRTPPDPFTGSFEETAVIRGGVAWMKEEDQVCPCSLPPIPSAYAPYAHHRPAWCALYGTQRTSLEAPYLSRIRRRCVVRCDLKRPNRALNHSPPVVRLRVAPGRLPSLVPTKAAHST